MTKETIIEEMEKSLIPLGLMNNREHQEFIKGALMGNLSKLADKIVKESDSLSCVSQRYTIEDIERCVENWGLCKVEKEYIEKFLNGV